MNKMLMSGLLLAAIGLHSCSDDDVLEEGAGGVPLEPGSEVVFGAGVGVSQTQSRTVYGPEDTENNVFPIYWKDSDDEAGLDKIHIHSPEAAEGKRIAQYYVKPSGEEHKGYSDVIKVDKDGDGVVLGTDVLHNFYGFYPASKVVQDQTTDWSGHYICGEMPSSQKVYCPDQASEGIYVAEHNMDYCFMTAHTEVKPVAGKPVQLQFKPWSTVLDITLPGPAADDAEYEITSVIVRSQSKTGTAPCIAGTFKYDFKTDNIELINIGNNAANEPDNILNVDIYKSDGTQGFVMRKGDKLNFKAFLLPVKDVTDIRVEVYAKGKQMWFVDLKKPEDGRDALLTPGSIHKVGLPTLNPDDARSDYSSWMTDLPDDLPLTAMSIPGAFDAFAGERKITDTKTMQTSSIRELFDAGIRAFHVPLKYSMVTGGDSRLSSAGGLLATSVLSDQKDENLHFGEMIHTLHQEMKSRGDKEFCVLMVEPVLGISSSIENYYKCLKAYINYMEREGITVDKTPTTFTLGELRGKVLVQFTFCGDPELTYTNCTSTIFRQNVTPGSTYDTHARISPMKAIMQWTAPENTTNSIWSWTQGTGATPGSMSIGAWSALEGAHGVFTWKTWTSAKEPTLTPVTLGRIGKWTINPQVYTEEYYKNLYGGSAPTDEQKEQTQYDDVYRTANIQAQVTDGSWGIGTFAVQSAIRNMKLIGTSDGADRNKIYTTSLDITFDARYSWCTNFDNFFWWYRGSTLFKHDGVASIFNVQDDALNIMDKMWTHGGSEVGSRIRAMHYWRRFPLKTFISTTAAVLGTEEQNNVLLDKYIELTLSAQSDGSYTANSELKNEMPLGIVFLPFVPTREEKLTDTNATRMKVRKVVHCIADHNKNYSYTDWVKPV